MNPFTRLTEAERRAVETALTAVFVLADSTKAWGLLVDALDATEPPAPNAATREDLVQGVRWATIPRKHDFASKFVGAVVHGTSDAACALLITASALALGEAASRTHPIWDQLAGINPAGPLLGPRPEKPSES